MHEPIEQVKTTVKKHDRKIRLTSHFVMAFALFVIFSTLFVKLAKDVREQDTMQLDKTILLTINSWSNHALDTAVLILTNFGGPVIAVALTIVVAALFLYKREYYRTLIVLIGVGGASVLNLILKAIFERPRPTLWDRLVVEHGFSFPSGHAMASSALGIAIAVALWHSRWRWWGFTAATVYVLFIGFSRLYLGVHYPTDILAGWLVSGAWVMAVALILNTRLARGLVARRSSKH